MNIADLRKDYKLASLDDGDIDLSPFRQFERWMKDAIDASLPEPTAMTLATVGADSRPSTRVVLLKGFDERGPVWYTNPILSASSSARASAARGSPIKGCPEGL